MLLYLINPINSVVSLNQTKKSLWNKYRIWKPLSLLVLAGLTPHDWEIKIIDENISIPDYGSMPKPELLTPFSDLFLDNVPTGNMTGPTSRSKVSNCSAVGSKPVRRGVASGETPMRDGTTPVAVPSRTKYAATPCSPVIDGAVI